MWSNCAQLQANKGRTWDHLAGFICNKWTVKLFVKLEIEFYRYQSLLIVLIPIKECVP